MKRAANRTRALVRRIATALEAARITLWARYERIRPPELDHDFRAGLCSQESPFTKLLATNGNAVEEAERVLDQRFRVFGLEVNASGAGFSWHKDFKGGTVYPKLPFPKIHSVPDRGCDPVIPWELSRLQFVPTLIQAHHLTGDPRYAQFFERVANDWIEENPYLIGIHWRTGMDPAIRGMNLAFGLLCFYDHLRDASTRYSKVLWAHAEHLYARDFRRLRSHRNNHFLISAVGLLALSLCFRGKRAAFFFDTSMKHLAREIARQFRPDGGHFESAVHYHQLSLEAVLVAACFLSVKRLAHSPSSRQCCFSREVQDRIAKSVMLVSDYMNAFGRSPQFGDSDDGRILIFKDYYSWKPVDHRFIGELSTVAFPEIDLHSDEIINHVYRDSGYGFFRSDAYGVCLNASPVGEDGGHNHNDKASFVLQVGGNPVLIDSGTYCYSPDLRARFAHRRTRAHNVVMVDGREQAEINPARVFDRPEGTEARIRYEMCGALPTWTMEHDGYRRFQELGGLRRIVRCAPRRVDIEEHIEGQGEHTVEVVFNLHPRIRCDVQTDEVRCVLEDKLLCRLEIPDGFRVHRERASYSSAYTEREAHDVIVLSRRALLPLIIRHSVHV